MPAETSLPGAVNPGNQNNKPTLAIRVSEHEATEEGAPVALGSDVPLTKQARLAIGFKVSEGHGGDGVLFTELPSFRKGDLGLRPLVTLFPKLFFFLAGQGPWGSGPWRDQRRGARVSMCL